MRAPTRRELLQATAIFVCVLGLWLTPWPGIDRSFNALVCGVANAIGFERTLDSGFALHFHPIAEADLGSHRAFTRWHAMLEIRNTTSQAATELAYNTRIGAYVPFAAFWALIAATRIWRRRHGGVAIAAGAFALAMYVGTGILLIVLSFLARPRIGAVELGASARAAIEAVSRALFIPPSMTYVIPAGIVLSMLWLTRPGNVAEAPMSYSPRSRPSERGVLRSRR
jgi:hypothetical protein